MQLDQRDKWRETPLHKAARFGNGGIVKALCTARMKVWKDVPLSGYGTWDVSYSTTHSWDRLLKSWSNFGVCVRCALRQLVFTPRTPARGCTTPRAACGSVTRQDGGTLCPQRVPLQPSCGLDGAKNIAGWSKQPCLELLPRTPRYYSFAR